MPHSLQILSAFITFVYTTNSQSILKDSKKILHKELALILIGCSICICLTCWIICCYSCRSKRRKQEVYRNKTLTTLEINSVKVRHYADTSTLGDIVLPSTFQTSTRGSTPAPIPEALSAVTSLSNDNESSSQHEFGRNVATTVSDETLMNDHDIVPDLNLLSFGTESKEEEKKHEKHISLTITSLYHEHQKWELCLLHALNSLLQKEKFTHKSLDEICKLLAPNKMINPHKSILQTGNYDANVLMMALSNVNIEVQWFDARKATHELNLNDPLFLEPDKSMKFEGFILNNPHKAVFGMVKRRHWLAIKKIKLQWYNLDSKLNQPEKYKNAKELNEFLVDVLTANNAELMICRQKRK